MAGKQFLSVDFGKAQCLHACGKVLFGAERGEAALTAFEQAIAAFDRAGHPDVTERFETIRMAAVVELNVLDRVPAALARLDAAIADADRFGHGGAAEVLRRLRASRR